MCICMDIFYPLLPRAPASCEYLYTWSSMNSILPFTDVVQGTQQEQTYWPGHCQWAGTKGLTVCVPQGSQRVTWIQSPTNNQAWPPTLSILPPLTLVIRAGIPKGKKSFLLFLIKSVKENTNLHKAAQLL